MPRSSRALLFDLDDTLYPLRRFTLSGFAAVARHVARFHHVDEKAAFQLLVSASRGEQRGRELQALTTRFNLNVPVTALVRVIRAHQPALRLPPTTESTLRRVRRSWKVAIVTNGIPAIQRAKIEALGVQRLVDTVVYASEHGSGEGKPDREPFFEALRRLDIAPSQAIAVGDDDFADVFGAARCGLQTVKTREWRRGPAGPVSVCADAIVERISDVPLVAENLVPKRLVRHAA